MFKLRNIYFDIIAVTIAITASSFIAGIEGIILYFYFFEGTELLFTTSLPADILLFVFGLVGFYMSVKGWWRNHKVISNVKKDLANRNSREF